MTIEIENEVSFDFGFDTEEVLKKVLASVEETVDIDERILGSNISVTITDNDAIKEINNEYRRIDKETDVLSFPMFEYDTPGMPLEIFPEEELILGDIVISVDKCKEQAEEYGHSLLREFAFLFTHGMLHILGFDHEIEEDRVLMEKYQDLVLNNCNITRD